jgi:hypothetical protein
MATVDTILAGKYPAKAHARRVAESLQSHRNGCPGIVYLEAQKTRLIEDNDEPVPFRYETASYSELRSSWKDRPDISHSTLDNADHSSTYLDVCYRTLL